MSVSMSVDRVCYMSVVLIGIVSMRIDRVC